MTREKFISLDKNPVSRVIARTYTPTLQWVLYHKKTFMIAPVLILFTGLSVWLGIHRTLMPLEWAVNMFASEKASPELKAAMYADKAADLTRPLLELDQLRWQSIRESDGGERTRLLWRRQDSAKRATGSCLVGPGAPAGASSRCRPACWSMELPPKPPRVRCSMFVNLVGIERCRACSLRLPRRARLTRRGRWLFHVSWFGLL